jgi:hypothetical protein
MSYRSPLKVADGCQTGSGRFRLRRNEAADSDPPWLVGPRGGGSPPTDRRRGAHGGPRRPTMSGVWDVARPWTKFDWPPTPRSGQNN